MVQMLKVVLYGDYENGDRNEGKSRRLGSVGHSLVSGFRPLSKLGDGGSEGVDHGHDLLGIDVGAESLDEGFTVVLYDLSADEGSLVEAASVPLLEEGRVETLGCGVGNLGDVTTTTGEVGLKVLDELLELHASLGGSVGLFDAGNGPLGGKGLVEDGETSKISDTGLAALELVDQVEELGNLAAVGRLAGDDLGDLGEVSRVDVGIDLSIVEWRIVEQVLSLVRSSSHDTGSEAKGEEGIDSHFVSVCVCDTRGRNRRRE